MLQIPLCNGVFFCRNKWDVVQLIVCRHKNKLYAFMNNIYLNGYSLDSVSIQNAKRISLYSHIRKILPGIITQENIKV